MCQRGFPTFARSGAARSRVTSATFAVASWSRDSPTARHPNRDKVTTSIAGKYLVIGKTSISAALRPAACAAAARRERTAANAWVNSDSRSPHWTRPPPSRSLHPDQRGQPAGGRLPAMTEQRRVGDRAPRIDIDRGDAQTLELASDSGPQVKPGVPAPVMVRLPGSAASTSSAIASGTS